MSIIDDYTDIQTRLDDLKKEKAKSIESKDKPPERDPDHPLSNNWNNIYQNADKSWGHYMGLGIDGLCS